MYICEHKESSNDHKKEIMDNICSIQLNQINLMLLHSVLLANDHHLLTYRRGWIERTSGRGHRKLILRFSITTGFSRKQSALNSKVLSNVKQQPGV